ncbi:hypothetical protein C8R47DRAFT_767944 [Mycena vitilis]|nr:hypothetical protein C8R47DRAFT_767944 [Mycena vitilis]
MRFGRTRGIEAKRGKSVGMGGLFLQSNPNDRGSRTNLDQDACFQPVRQLICTLLSHLVASERAWVHLHLILFDIYDSDPAAKDALVNRLGGDRPLRRDGFTNYLRHHTPTVVLKDLRDGETMSWGVVAKGDEPGAEGNELYLSLELTEALIQAPPPELSPEDAEDQQTRHKFLFSISFIHACIHALTKHFFSHHLTTPKLSQSVPDASGEHGDAGSTFERGLLGGYPRSHLEQAGYVAPGSNVAYPHLGCALHHIPKSILHAPHRRDIARPSILQ